MSHLDSWNRFSTLYCYLFHGQQRWFLQKKMSCVHSHHREIRVPFLLTSHTSRCLGLVFLIQNCWMQFSVLIINGREQALWELSGSRCFFSTPFWVLRTMWASGTLATAHSVVSGLHVQLSPCKSFLDFLCSILLLKCILCGHLIRHGNNHLYILLYIQMCLMYAHRVPQVITLCE